jgi:hypothetical protein
VRAELVGGPNDGQIIVAANSPMNIRMPITDWPGIVVNPTNHDPFANSIAVYRKRLGTLYTEYDDGNEASLIYDFEGVE